MLHLNSTYPSATAIASPPSPSNETKAKFTTNYIPDGPGLNGSYQVPLGFILSPLAFHREDNDAPNASSIQTNPNNQQIVLSNNDMITCEKCFSILNPYCSYETHHTNTGSRSSWTCPICHHVNTSPIYYYNEYDETKRQYIINSDVVEYHQTRDPQQQQHQHQYNFHDGTRNHTICKTNQLIVIVIDGNLPPSEVQSIFQSLSSTLSERTKIGLIIYTSNIHIYQLGIHGGLLASADIYSFYQQRYYNRSDSIDTSGIRVHDDENDGYDEYYDHEIDEIYKHELQDEKERMYVGSLEQAKLCASSYFGFSSHTSSVNPAGATTTASNDGLFPIDKNECFNGSTNNNSNTSSSTKPLSRKEMLRLRRENRRRDKSVFQQDQLNNTLEECSSDYSAQYLNHLRSKQTTPGTVAGAVGAGGNRRIKRRCTGEAIAHAYTLLANCMERPRGSRHIGDNDHDNDDIYDHGRILLFTNGCCNFGKGNVTTRKNDDAVVIDDNDEYLKQNLSNSSYRRSGDIIDPIQLENASKYFHQIGKESFDHGIGIDVFCSGTTSTFGSQALLELVKCSAGYVLTHGCFEGVQFLRNLEYVVTKTCMVRDGCLLDIRMTRGISPKTINGCISVVEADHKKYLLQNECDGEILESTRTRLQIGRLDPKSTISVMIHVDDDADGEALKTNNAVFQFIVRYTNPHNPSDFITRVVTQQLDIITDTTSSDGGFIQFFNSLQMDILPTLLAKEAAYRCMVYSEDVDDDEEDNALYGHEEIEDAVLKTQEELDTTVHRIIDICKQQSDATVDIEQTAFGESIRDEIIFKRLHHFRRGIILGSNTQSSDDRALLRDLFLRMPLHDCLLMMVPELWVYYFDNGEVFSTHAPAETLAMLDDNCVIAADNFDSMFVCSGIGTQDPSYDILRDNCFNRLQESSRHRFPAPMAYAFNEGDSMARRLTSRLVPSHGDKEEDWVANFPLLANRTYNKDKFRTCHESNSDRSFRRWYAFVANTKSKKWKNERSLCDA